METFGFSPAQHLVYLWVTPMQLLLFWVFVMQLLSFRFTVFRQWHPNAVFPGVVFDSPNIGSDTNMVLENLQSSISIQNCMYKYQLLTAVYILRQYRWCGFDLMGSFRLQDWIF